MQRHSALVVLSVLALACNDSPSAPEGALVGEFGGDRVSLTASGNQFFVLFNCESVVAKQPLVPRSDGRFFVAVGPSNSFPSSVILRGTVMEPVITFEIVRVELDTIHVSNWTVTRGEQARFGVCPLRGRT